MTSATVAAKTAASSGKPEKIRKDHNINWWLTAAVAVLFAVRKFFHPDQYDDETA